MIKTLLNSDFIADYVNHNLTKENDILKELRALTETLPDAQMLLAADQGAFLQFLIKLTNAKNVIEIGTFTGYSSLCMAMSLPKDGHIIACDINEEWTNIAKTFWQKAGIENKIDLKIAPAIDTLNNLIAQNYICDFVFIDANKKMNFDYYECGLSMLKTGGLIVIDNAIPFGLENGWDNLSKLSHAIDEANQKIIQDKRSFSSIVTIGAGFLLSVKL